MHVCLSLRLAMPGGRHHVLSQQRPWRLLDKGECSDPPTAEFKGKRILAPHLNRPRPRECVSLGRVTAGWYMLSTGPGHTQSSWKAQHVLSKLCPKSKPRLTPLCGTGHRALEARLWLGTRGSDVMAYRDRVSCCYDATSFNCAGSTTLNILQATELHALNV